MSKTKLNLLLLLALIGVSVLLVTVSDLRLNPSSASADNGSASSKGGSDDPKYSNEVYDKLKSELQTLANFLVVDRDLPGISVSVILDSGKKFNITAGEADPVDGNKMKKRHRFGIGSIDKNLTAVTVLKLVDDGLLGLDDTLDEFLNGSPTDPFLSIPHNDVITVRMLLNGEAGIFNADTTNSDFSRALPYLLAWLSDLTFERSADSYLALPLVVSDFNDPTVSPDFFPAADFGYNNINWTVARAIINRVTGRQWADVFIDEIAKPNKLSGMAKMELSAERVANGFFGPNPFGVPIFTLDEDGRFL